MHGMAALIALIFCWRECSAQQGRAKPPIPVKVVVVAMFERGEDTGDAPGEYQYWVEREHLDEILPMPAGYHHVRMNKDGVLGLLTGVGTAKAAASVMALGLDPRFDLTRAYWVIAGIGGGDPADVSLGSAVWVGRVIDGDLAFELDARQIPADWPTGYVPLGKSKPYEQPMSPARAGIFPDRSGFDGLGLLVDARYGAKGHGRFEEISGAFCGISQCASAAVCDARRSGDGKHVLARFKNGGLGEPVGEVLQRRQSELYGLRHGRFRNTGGADVFE